MPRRIIAKDIDEQIISATIKIGAEEGVVKASAQKIARICKIDHAVVLRHFSGIRGCWDAAARRIDTTGMSYMKKLLEEGNDKHQIWNKLLDNFITNSDNTRFYNSYILAFGFDPTTNNERAAEFLIYSKLFFGKTAFDSDDNYLMLWDYITTMAFYYADKIISGLIANDEKSRSLIENIVFFGLSQPSR